MRKSDLDPKKKDYAKYANVARSIYHTSSHYDDKYAAKSIRFIRELAVDEVFETVTDSEIRGWTEEQKKRAMETSINAVQRDIRAFELCAAGYSARRRLLWRGGWRRRNKSSGPSFYRRPH